MSGEIDGHCLTLHHPFIVSLNVFTTLFLLHLHFASLDMAISEAARDIHFLELMHFIWSAKPPQLTSCHSGVSYDITPLAVTVPPPHPHPLPPPSIPPLPWAITMSDRHRMQRYCVLPGVICPSCSIRLSLPNIFPQEWLFLGFILHNGWSRGPVVSNSRHSEGSECTTTARGPANQGTRGVLEGLMAFWCS